MNSMPNSTSTRILDLKGSYYSIDLRKINLMLFYLISEEFLILLWKYEKNSYRFTSKDFTTNLRKKRKMDLKIKVKPNC
jgi:hypothetical protein